MDNLANKLLQEDGFGILLEDGSGFLLLENDAVPGPPENEILISILQNNTETNIRLLGGLILTTGIQNSEISVGYEIVNTALKTGLSNSNTIIKLEEE